VVGRQGCPAIAVSRGFAVNFDNLAKLAEATTALRAGTHLFHKRSARIFETPALWHMFASSTSTIAPQREERDGCGDGSQVHGSNTFRSWWLCSAQRRGEGRDMSFPDSHDARRRAGGLRWRFGRAWDDRPCDSAIQSLCRDFREAGNLGDAASRIELDRVVSFDQSAAIRVEHLPGHQCDIAVLQEFEN